MADADDIYDAVVANVQGPSSASNDQGSVTQHDPLKALDVLDRIENRAARGNPFARLQRVKIVPPGGG